jgi:hypothetical protein
MGGYFMPTSVAPSLSVTGLISQGLGLLGPIIQGLVKSPAAGVVATTAGKVAGAITKTVGVGVGVGAGASLTDEIIKRMTTGQGISGIGLGGRKRRRINVLNPRALRRSMRRVQGFSKFARKSFILEKRVKMKRRRR